MNIVVYDSWDVAGNNGEFLYRKVREMRPDWKMTFLISDKCQDWERLNQDGFNLCPIQSSKVEGFLASADIAVFSQMSLKKLQQKYRNKGISLKHGILSDISDLSGYYRNAVSQCAKYSISSSLCENELIKRYSSGKLQPILCGYPRHDILIQKYRKFLETNPASKSVLIQFHWRYGDIDQSREKFMSSQYLDDINSLLNYKGMENLVQEGWKIRFLPHARFKKYLDCFSIPDYIEVPRECQFQDILVQSDMLITDFSSNSFEMAYMDKPSIFYVPGMNEIDSKSSYRPENIKNHENLFPCSSRQEVIDTVVQLGRRKGEFNFSSRIFQYVDTNNTSRLIEWIETHESLFRQLKF